MNPDIMPHNLVIVAPGKLEAVGALAEAMASRPDGFQKSFVPATPDVLVLHEVDQPRCARADPRHRARRAGQLPVHVHLPRALEGNEWHDGC